MEGKDRLTSKVFNDPIHGHIELPPLCVKIIDTPSSKDYGSSNSLEYHTLSTLEHLIIDLSTVLGHGPFSHVFDNKFIPAVCPDSKWKHEQASVDMFEYLVRENKLEDEFKVYDLDETDQKFIKEQIVGVSKQGEGRPLEGRPKAKYLYEVVANKRNGIDVDKWDYFARDCHMLGIKNNFDHNRCIHFARVLQVEGEWQICCRDKEIGTIYDMFYTRTNLHRRAYQHKTTNIIEYMVVEALVLANDHIKLHGEDGKTQLKMSEAINDMTVFSQLTDEIFSRILHSHETELAQSREILRNILTRKLYKFMSKTQTTEDMEKKKPDIIAEVVSRMDPGERKDSGMTENDIVLLFVNHDYGMKERNPVDNVRFYSKEDPDVAVMIPKEQESSMLPENFKEQVIRIYSKKRDRRSCNMVKVAFERWCADNKFPPQKLIPLAKGKPNSDPATSLLGKRTYPTQ